MRFKRFLIWVGIVATMFACTCSPVSFGSIYGKANQCCAVVSDAHDESGNINVDESDADAAARGMDVFRMLMDVLSEAHGPNGTHRINQHGESATLQSDVAIVHRHWRGLSANKPTRDETMSAAEHERLRLREKKRKEKLQEPKLKNYN